MLLPLFLGGAGALPFAAAPDITVTVRATTRTITVGVDDGALISQHPTDAVVYTVDWSAYLPDTALIDTSTFTVTAVRGTAPTADEDGVLAGSQSAQVRLTAGSAEGAICRVDHRIVTNELTPRTIERSWLILVERIVERLAVKDPSDVALCLFDWSDHLGDALITGSPTITITALRPTGDTALTQGSDSVLDGEQSAQVLLTAGTLGALYRVDHTVVTDESPAQTITRSLLLLMEQR